MLDHKRPVHELAVRGLYVVRALTLIVLVAVGVMVHVCLLFPMWQVYTPTRWHLPVLTDAGGLVEVVK